MRRDDIIVKRIMEILDGKLLRFTDIQKEYEVRYKEKAFQQVSNNLKLLQTKGVVLQIEGRFCLTSDLEAICALIKNS